MGTLVAQTTSSLLWEIKTSKRSKPSYLFGTIHISNPEVFAFDQVVYEKLKQSKLLVLELIPDQIPPQELYKAMSMDSSLEQLLSPSDYDFLANKLEEEYHIPVRQVDRIKPFFLNPAVLDPGEQSEEGGEPMDVHLLNLSRGWNKEIAALETLQEQIQVIDQVSLRDQAALLLESLRSDSASDADFHQLLDVYLRQDIEALVELADNEGIPVAFRRALLDDRNNRMASRILDLIQHKRCFIAVGAGHLGGSAGLIRLLSGNVYSITPIHFTFNHGSRDH